jgi:hypothetical protein
METIVAVAATQLGVIMTAAKKGMNAIDPAPLRGSRKLNMLTKMPIAAIQRAAPISADCTSGASRNNAPFARTAHMLTPMMYATVRVDIVKESPDSSLNPGLQCCRNHSASNNTDNFQYQS